MKLLASFEVVRGTTAKLTVALKICNLCCTWHMWYRQGRHTKFKLNVPLLYKAIRKIHGDPLLMAVLWPQRCVNDFKVHYLIKSVEGIWTRVVEEFSKCLCNVGGYFRTEFAFIFIKVGHGSRSTNTQTRMRIFAKLSLLRR